MFYVLSKLAWAFRWFDFEDMRNVSSPNYFRMETNTKEGMVQFDISSHATRPFIAKICVSSKDHKKIIQVNRFFSSAFIMVWFFFLPLQHANHQLAGAHYLFYFFGIFNTLGWFLLQMNNKYYSQHWRSIISIFHSLS